MEFAPTPAELLRKYGARKIQDDRYEISAINLPWVLKTNVEITVAPSDLLVIEGVEVRGLEPPWEAYVALVDATGEMGVGTIITWRRRLFRCVYKPYAAPPGVKIPPYIQVKPIELWLSDGDTVNCIERGFTAKFIALFINAPAAILDKLDISFKPLVRFK